MTEMQVVRQLNNLMRRVDEIPCPERSPDLVSPFLALPMLRGLWVASVNNAGNWYDLSGLSKTLTYNGNPTFNYSGLVPYWDYDGTEDYHSRADEADLDIIGTESYVASAARGLTLGGWFWLDNLTAQRGFISKYNIDAVNERAYILYYDLAANRLQFIISTDGIAATIVAATDAPSATTWYFVVGRFTPSTEIKIWTNAATNTNTVGIPASIFNSNANFEIGSYSVGTNNLDGRATLCFLCAAALSDGQISSAFQQTRGAFGV